VSILDALPNTLPMATFKSDQVCPQAFQACPSARLFRTTPTLFFSLHRPAALADVRPALDLELQVRSGNAASHNAPKYSSAKGVKC
jgi:hypothetical protein